MAQTDRPPAESPAGALAGALATAAAGQGRDDAGRGPDDAPPSSSDYLRLLLECSAEGFYAVDRDGRTTLANKTFLQMLGFADEAQAMGRQLHDVVHHSHPDGSHYSAASCPIYICARDGTPAHVTGEQFYRLDGTKLDVEYWAYPVRRDGVLLGAVCTFIDVTERKRVEARLREAERLNALILQSSRDCIVALDLDANTRFVSPGGIAAMEIADVDTIIGLSWLRVWDGADNLAARAAVAEARSGGVGRFQAFCATHLGTPKWWDVVVSPLPGANGDPEGLVAIARDISDQQIAEALLRDTEERRRQAVEAADIATWSLDPSTCDLHCDARCRELYGIGDADVAYDAYLAAIHPDDRERVLAISRGALDSAGSGVYRAEYRTAARGGSERWVAVAGRTQFEDGRPVRMVGTAMDVTARRNAVEQARLLGEEMQHRVKNTLSMVQAIVRQTLRGAATMDAAQANIDLRLTALARAHELLMQAAWHGAELGAVAQAAILPHDDGSPGRIRIQGPVVWLTSSAALSLALLLHELATNATKYGSLSAPGGRVDVTWSIAAAPPSDGLLRLHFVWRESGGPPVTEPAARGFGTKLIEHGLASAFGGQPVLRFPSDGVVCEIDGRLPALGEPPP